MAWILSLIYYQVHLFYDGIDYGREYGRRLFNDYYGLLRRYDECSIIYLYRNPYSTKNKIANVPVNYKIDACRTIVRVYRLGLGPGVSGIAHRNKCVLIIMLKTITQMAWFTMLFLINQTVTRLFLDSVKTAKNF